MTRGRRVLACALAQTEKQRTRNTNMKLNTIKRGISKTANARGHRLSWGAPFGRSNGPWSVSCKCLKCGMEGIALESPAPNQINQSGEVLALNCTA